eukprot:UN28893
MPKKHNYQTTWQNSIRRRASDFSRHLKISIEDFHTKRLVTKPLNKFFPMPMPVAIKFCECLDEYKSEIIDFDPMFSWLKRYNRGSIIDKVDILFKTFGGGEIKREGRKVLFLVLSAVCTPVSLYFNVTENLNAVPQLTPKQKQFIKSMLDRVFGNKEIQVKANGTFDPSEFIRWIQVARLIPNFETTLIKASQEIKRPQSLNDNQEEVRMEKLLKYLNSRFPYKTISFDTMLTQFPMPGKFGERFCTYFDNSNCEIIDFAQLEKWLQQYSTSTVYDKVKLLLLIYGEGKLIQIEEQELVDVLTVLLLPFVYYFLKDDESDSTQKKDVKDIKMPTLDIEMTDLLSTIIDKSNCVDDDGIVASDKF